MRQRVALQIAAVILGIFSICMLSLYTKFSDASGSNTKDRRITFVNQVRTSPTLKPSGELRSGALSIIKNFLLVEESPELVKSLRNAGYEALAKQTPSPSSMLRNAYDKIKQDTMATLNGSIFHRSPCRPQTECSKMAPMLCSLVTSVDFFAQLTMIVRTDVTVASYYIVVDGDNTASSMAGHFWTAVAELISPKSVGFPPPMNLRLNSERMGVSNGWNRCIREAFAKVTENGRYPSHVIGDHWDPHDAERLNETTNAVQLELPYIIIANSDLWPRRGWVRKLVETSFEGQDIILLNRFASFAYFAYTKRAYHALGYFDEVFYPAYAEDQEMHARAVSIGLGEVQYIAQCCHGHADHMFQHLVSINVKHDKSTRYYAIDPNDYILKKWGFHRGELSDYRLSKPFRHPFNNSRIATNNSWVVDPVHRACLKRVVRLEKTQCAFNVDVVRVLEGLAYPPVGIA